MRIITILLAIIALSGCITVGRDFKVVDDSAIVLGKTTQEEVIRLMGQPYSEDDDGLEFTDAGLIHFNYAFVSGGLVKKQSLFFMMAF